MWLCIEVMNTLCSICLWSSFGVNWMWYSSWTDIVCVSMGRNEHCHLWLFVKFWEYWLIRIGVVCLRDLGDIGVICIYEWLILFWGLCGLIVWCRTVPWMRLRRSWLCLMKAQCHPLMLWVCSIKCFMLYIGFLVITW